jgi:peptide deformylase
MVRPKTVLVRGVSVNGEVIEIEADELEARMFQHEIDHLNGVLMFDRLDGDRRKEALREYRRIEEQAAADAAAARGGLRRRLKLS